MQTVDALLQCALVFLNTCFLNSLKRLRQTIENAKVNNLYNSCYNSNDIITGRQISLKLKMNELQMSSLTPDEVLEEIGSFSRYQIRLLFLMGFMKIVRDGFQMMITTFLAAEPPWTCVTNSSSCNITENILPGHEFYNLRCRLPRSEWEFNTTEFSSIVSEVRYLSE